MQRLNCNWLVRPWVHLQLPSIALLPLRIQVQYGCDAAVVNALITVIVQGKAAVITCRQGCRTCEDTPAGPALLFMNLEPLVNRAFGCMYSWESSHLTLRNYISPMQDDWLTHHWNLVCRFDHIAGRHCCTCIELHLDELAVQRQGWEV